MDLAELHASPFRAAAQHVALLVLRLIAGVSMIVHHAWAMVYTGWRYYWKGEEWILIDAANALGLAPAAVWATAVSLTFFLGSVFLVLGLLGRITSGVLLAATLAVLYALIAHGTPGDPETGRFWIEVCILYAMAYIVHFILGPGMLALDRMLALFLGPRRHRSLEDVE